MLEQNIMTAIMLATAGGFFQVLSVLILAYPEHLKVTRGKNFKKPMRRVLIPINVFIQLFNGAATTGAAIFGPVAIIMPVTVSSQLLFNILIFGFLKMETFDKDVQVGTFIVVLGSVLLPVVGPDVQQNQNILELLTAPQAFVWTTVLFIGVSISGILCFGCVNKKWEAESIRVYVTLAIARVSSSVLSASLSKTLALVSGIPLIVVIVGFCICGIVLGTSVVLQATKTEQKLFVPLISCLTQIVNAATGLILWEDWKVVKSWTGYAAVTVQIVVGVYLISSLDFFANIADPNYGLKQSASLRKLYGNDEERKKKIKETVKVIETEQKDAESPKLSSQIEYFNDDSGRYSNSVHMSTSSSTIVRRLDELSTDNRHHLPASVRGLIGGITTELSYSKIDKVIAHTEDDIMVRALELAEEAAKKGEERFVTPPTELEMNIEVFKESIESLSDGSEDEGNGNDRNQSWFKLWDNR